MGIKMLSSSAPSPTWLLAIPVVVTIRVLLRIIHNRRNQKEMAPPFPGIPLIPYPRHWLSGHMRVPEGSHPQFKRQKVWCVDHADPKTGLCSFYLLSRPVVSVLKAEHAQKILRSSITKNRFNDYSLIRRFVKKAFGETNFVTMNGRDWKVHRTTVVKSVQSEKALLVAQGHIMDVGHALVKSIVSFAESNKSQPIKATKLMKMATLDVFVASALGKDLGCCRTLESSVVATSFDVIEKDLGRRFRFMLNPTSHLYFIPTEANRKYHQASGTVKKFLKDAIQDHLRRAKNPTIGEEQDTFALENNLLAKMISANYQGDMSNADVEELSSLLTVLLFAGYDTTANALSWALSQIATNPEVERNCLEEAHRVLGANDGKISVNDDRPLDVLNDLSYCHAVLIEALRLYPVATQAARTLEKHLVLDGVNIPAGTQCRIPIFQIHRDERNFHRAEEFLVHRWVRQTEDGSWIARERGDEAKEDAKSSNFVEAANRDAFLAFSSGARNCAGRRFALQEGTLLLALLVRGLTFEVEPGYELDMAQNGLIMEPKDGLPMRFHCRSK